MDRREILKMFGITVAAGATGVAVTKAAEVAPEPLQVWGPGGLQPPEGMVYQWKRVFMTGDEPDLENLAKMIAFGWKPVPRERHHSKLGESNALGSYWIEQGGLVLMEKPADQIPPPQKYPVPFEADDTDEWVEE